MVILLCFFDNVTMPLLCLCPVFRPQAEKSRLVLLAAAYAYHITYKCNSNVVKRVCKVYALHS